MNNPLKYFEDLLQDKNSLQNKIHQFVEAQISREGDFTDIDKDNGLLKELKSFYDEKRNVIIEAYGYVRFTDDFYPEFSEQTIYSLKAIQNLVHESIKNDADISKYIKFLTDTLITLKKTATTNYPQFSFIAVKLNSILFELKKIISTHPDVKQYSHVLLTIDAELSKDLKLQIPSEDKEIIQSVLGFLKRKNDQQEQILSIEDYNYLVEIVNEYVEKNTLLSLTRKIHINKKVSKPLLSFTFWVLHKHLFTTRPIRKGFIEMIQSVFKDFDDWDADTFRKKIGSRDKVTYKGVKFIPDIIKQELEKD